MSSTSEPLAYAGELFSLLGEAAPLLVADLIAARAARGDRQGARQWQDVQACLGHIDVRLSGTTFPELARKAWRGRSLNSHNCSVPPMPPIATIEQRDPTNPIRC